MTISCCNCGINIIPNQRNMCERCLYNVINISNKIRTNTVIESCRGCERYFVLPKSFREFAWRSQDLMIYCLSRNKTIKKLNIVDSNWIYTEEHSQRMMIECKIEEEGLIQTVVLKFIIRNKQCGECMRAESKQFWNSCVQIRQHPHNKRTFLYLEQLIKMHKAHLNTTNIKGRKDGIDFYFSNKIYALKFTKFIENFYGIKVKESNRLISEDKSNNTTNMKSTFSCQLIPLCKDDLVVIDNKMYLVDKVNSSVDFIDIETMTRRTVTNKQYFGDELKYKKLLGSVDSTEYDVIFTNKNREGYYDVSIIDDKERVYEVKTMFDFKEGDKVLGYHVEGKTFLDEYCLDDVILFREYNNHDKHYNLIVDKELDREMRLFLADIDREMFKEVAEEELDDLSKKFIKAMQ